MKKKLLYLFLICVSMFFASNVIADDNLSLEYTNSNCSKSGYTKNECSRYKDCVWIDSQNCGIRNSISSYKCTYSFKSGKLQAMITAYFNSNGLSSVEYINNETNNIGNTARVIGENGPITFEKDGEVYFTCPNEIYEVTSLNKTEIKDDTGVVNRAISTSRGTDSNEFTLLKDNNYTGIMMLKDSSNNKETPQKLEPKTCNYKKVVGRDERTISITYHDKDNVSATYNGLSVNGIVKSVNTDFIKTSEYFKKWECAPDNKVYAYVGSDNVLYVAYDKSLLSGHDNVFEYKADEDVDPEEQDKYKAVCGVLTENAQKFIYNILDWIKYIALVLAIGLSVLDFFKVVASEEDDAFTKAGKRLAKRIAIVVVLFLLPVILEFVLKLVHIQGVDTSNPMCK